MDVLDLADRSEVLTVDMQGYELQSDGRRGEPLEIGSVSCRVMKREEVETSTAMRTCDEELRCKEYYHEMNHENHEMI